MASDPIPRKWTIEEYLTYEEETGVKHEYIDGEIYAMSGGSDNHSAITINATTEISPQVRDSSCRVHSSDLRIQITKTKYVYPDFSVVCGKALFADENHTMLMNPILVAEVLSPSSADYDKGLKSELYRSLTSLQAYLLIDQNRAYVQLFTRQVNGWLLQEFKQLDITIPLDMIGCNLPLREIYRDIAFDEASEKE